MVALLATIPIVTGACSSDEPALCEDLRSFQATLQSVLSVNVTSQGPDEVADQVELAMGTLETVKETAGEVFDEDLAAIEASLTELGGLVDEVQGGTPASEVAPQVDDALTGLRTALDGLVDTAQAQDCDLRS